MRRKIRIAPRVEHGTEQIRPAGDFRDYPGGGAFGLLRRRAVDRHDEVARLFREGLAQLDVELPEVELRREHFGGVGVDLYRARGIDPGRHRARDG